MNHSKLSTAVLLAFSFTVLVAFTATAGAQQVEFAVGVNTLAAPGASYAQGNHAPVSLNGGAYASFSGDAIFFKNFGVQGELAWKWSRGEWGGYQPYRPMFYDFNGMWAPHLNNKVQAELLAGIGAQSTRFYTPNQVCDFYTCTNYVSINHFMGHFGGGLKAYIHGGLFVRPEVHLYLVQDDQEFSSGRALRYGFSVGYTFGVPR